MIDLRSDTITKPSDGMRAAMAAAEVGDDVYQEDPTIAELEARTADLLGHEAGLFVPSGTMSNLLGVWLNVPRGQEILCDELAHIVRAEHGSHANLHGITSRTWSSGGTGLASAAVIEALIAPPAGFLVQTAGVEIENTHNFGGGTIQPYDELVRINQVCRGAGVNMHLDGARLWNAHVVTGVAMRDYGTLFDTVSVCYSKGLGAPVGSVLVSNRANIDRARLQRKSLGGGMRQAGILAAGCLYALDHNVDRLADDHAGAAALAEAVRDRAPQAVGDAPQTNIVVLSTGARASGEVVAAAQQSGVAISGVGPHTVRAVTHLDVTADDCRQAGEILGKLLA
ncbi:MAG: beta-eliminating lyase-related protein [Propionibacteriaceae bacterium]|nr:beta-eliminating lyase-related protein [Propionibacteriaceae bacterium]